MNMLESVKEILDPLFPGLLGIQLSEVGPERVVASMEVRPELCTTGAVLHGGAIMAFADTLGAVATFANLPEGARTTTIESKTNFLGAAPARRGRWRWLAGARRVGVGSVGWKGRVGRGGGGRNREGGGKSYGGGIF